MKNPSESAPQYPKFHYASAPPLALSAGMHRAETPRTNPFLKTAVLPAACALAFALAIPDAAAAESFFDFTPAIPDTNANGVPLAGANTTFADGSGPFEPDVDKARSNDWTWRDFGNDGILNSLGPDSATPPGNTRELVTTVSGLEPGAEYAVKALFWGSGGSAPWGLRAGLVHAWGSRTNAGPATNVDWTSADLTGSDLHHLELSLPPATLSLLVIEPAPLRLTPAFLQQDGETRLAVTFQRLAKALGLRYVVLGSDDLATWKIIEEVEPGTPAEVTVPDDRAVGEAGRRFLRVELQREN